MDNLTAELKVWNNTTEANGGAENAFGDSGEERIYGYCPTKYGTNPLPNVDEPIIICSFVSFEPAGAITKPDAELSGQNFKYLCGFNAVVLLIWTGKQEAVIPAGRKYVSSLWIWLDEYNIQGWSDLVYSKGGATLVSEEQMAAMGKYGFRFLFYAERDQDRTRHYVDQSGASIP